MIERPPDPEPEQTPGLEPGGGVPPGETPPESASGTAAVSHQEPRVRRRAPIPHLLITALGVIAVAGIFAALAVTGLLMR